MPEVLRPERRAFNLTINERHDKPMTYTLAIVCVLADLTNFKTDPWNSFYAREALIHCPGYV